MGPSVSTMGATTGAPWEHMGVHGGTMGASWEHLIF